MSVGTGQNEHTESLRRALVDASATVGFEVHVRPIDPPRVPDALEMWDQAGEHNDCPQQLEVILRIDRAPDGRLSVEGGFVSWNWSDEVDLQADLRARGWEGDPPLADGHAWEIDLDDGSSLTLLLDDLRPALFAIGAQAGTGISFDVVRGADSPAIAPDEEWVDSASAAGLHSRLLALADARGGSVAIALTTRPGAVIRLEARRGRVWLLVIGRLEVDREGSAKAIRAVGWRPDREQQHFRRSWRLPRSGTGGVSSDRLFADLAQALAALAREPIGGAISVRLEIRRAEVAWRGDDSEEVPNGCLGWLLASALTVLAVIALAVAGFNLPPVLVDFLNHPGWKDTVDDGEFGGLLLLVVAWVAAMIPALTAAALVIWLANRVRVRYDPAYLIAEITAAAVTVAFFVALGLAGHSWGLLVASIYIGASAWLLITLVMDRLRRSAVPK